MAQAPTAHVPPQNLDAERSVLGAMLVAEPAVLKVIDEVKLSGEDFYLDKHRLIFGCMHDLYAASKPVDELSVVEALTQRSQIEEAGGKDYVSELAAEVPAAGNAKHYAEIVQENSLLRRLLGAGQEIQSWVHERQGVPRELSERAERLLFEVAHKEQASDFRTVGDILHDEIDRLEKLSTGDAEVTGTPSGFRDLDGITGGFQPGNLVIFAARPAMGKCLAGSTLVYDPTDGSRRRLDELYARASNGEEISVATLGKDMRLIPAKAAAISRNGSKPTFRLRTRLGRTIVGTANHRLLTLDGWRELGSLAPGHRIGVPRRLPWTGRPPATTDAEMVVLAALIADGNLTNRTPRFCYGVSSPMLPLVEDAAREIGVALRPDGHGSASLSNGKGSPRNPVTDLMSRHGLMGKKSDEKFVPDEIFGLDDLQISRFLAVLYGCDGHIYAGERLSQIGYTTISERLARDVQHLLLRLGIVSKIRTLKRSVYEGTQTVAREVLITGQRDLSAFCTRVLVCGKTEKRELVLERMGSVPRATNVDTIPAEVWRRIHEAKGSRSWADVSASLGRARNHNWHVGTRSVSRDLLEEIAGALDDEELRDLARSDVWWDEVTEIEPCGSQETFDLQVPGGESFVADDIVVHNSALVANIAENVAVKHGKPVAFFSLEMSEVELAQRFIANRARIPGDKLRKGKVSQRDWPKVVRACGELERAQLWFDDSSDLGMLDLRAKARRLHASLQARGGLGLVIVDYMQLMRADDPRANRVEQVGQMSRGLKILARELEIPVIAISQLSRAPEQRPDKRPILSDLRESGQIEQDADLVAFLYRDEYYNHESEDEGLAEVIIAKHRNGPIGVTKLAFISQYPKFMDRAYSDASGEGTVGDGAPMAEAGGVEF